MNQSGTNDILCPMELNAIGITVVFGLMFLSLVGNSLLIAVFYRKKWLRMPVHFLIMNMALSDILMPAIAQPMLISMGFHDSKLLCKFVSTVFYVSMSVSMFSMVAIAVDRCYAIVFAMKPALFSQKTCLRLIIVSWIVSVAIQGCFFEMYCHDALENIPFLCLAAFTAVILTVLYSVIIVFLYRQKADLHLVSETLKLRAKENRKITSMLVIIVVAFYVMWIPFLVYNSQKHNINYDCLWDWTSFIVGVLPMSYTVINFLVFVIFNEAFREGCKELLCRLWFCTKGNVCSRVSVAPQEHNNNAANTNQQNNTVENFELQEQ